MRQLTFRFIKTSNGKLLRTNITAVNVSEVKCSEVKWSEATRNVFTLIHFVMPSHPTNVTIKYKNRATVKTGLEIYQSYKCGLMHLITHTN